MTTETAEQFKFLNAKNTINHIINQFSKTFKKNASQKKFVTEFDRTKNKTIETLKKMKTKKL